MKLKQVKTCSTILIAAVMFLISYACTEQSLTVNDETKTIDGYETAERDAALAANYFSRTVGGFIAAGIGNQWIDNYKRNNGNVAQSYTIQTKTLKAILADDTCVGICFYYAKDSNNQLHILPRGVSTSGKLIQAGDMLIEKGTITNVVAQQWIANYQGSVKAHYWGNNTLTAFIETLHGNNVRTTLALNNSGQPQLLLSNAGIPNFDSGGLDISRPCPPMCP